ncbi:MAG: hypothetical protein ACFFC1_02475 [Promethearchaeota archaeon]
MIKVEDVILRVNNEDIPLNEIMSEVLTNIIIGFIDALKGIPKVKNHIKLEILL